MRPDPGSTRGIVLQCQTSEGIVEFAGFMHVVLATPATVSAQILRLYCDPLPSPSRHRVAVSAIVNCLQRFKYCQAVVINHADEGVLPSDARDWRDLNLVHMGQDLGRRTHRGTGDSEKGAPSLLSMTTHLLRLPSYAPSFPRIMQTTNPIMPVNESTILSRTVLDRAVVTAHSKAALQCLSQSPPKRWPLTGQRASSLGPLQGASPSGPYIWICGSYAFRGIPLLEGCVRSALDVVEQGILPTEGMSFVKKPW